jgi:hypothetical protein
MEVRDRPGLDDPVWEYLLRTRLEPYIEPARKWWTEVDMLEPADTGVYPIKDGPPGFMLRFTRTAIRSPIRGIQAFPFVPSAYLQLTGIQGGSVKMVERLCQDNTFIMDEFTIVVKTNLPSTYNQGQILCFIPTELLHDVASLGVWVYLTPSELNELGKASSLFTTHLQQKIMLKL